MIRITPMPSGISVVSSRIAQLHSTYIKKGVLPMLGTRFLSRLYDEIERSPRATVQVAMEKRQICGFIAGCYDIRSTYRYLVSHAAFGLLCATGRNIFYRSVLKRIWAVLAYPLQSDQRGRLINSTCPEILAVAVDESFRQKGVGRQLVREFERVAHGWGKMDRIRVATNIVEVEAKIFYERLGFHPVLQRRHHDLVLQIYEKTRTGKRA